MSNGAGRQDGLTPDMPDDQLAPDSGAPPDEASDAAADASPEPVRLKSPHSLERLRDRIVQAAQELERLRRENEALREHVASLETRPSVVETGSPVLTLDDDPAVLREKVEGFIRAIDSYLAGGTV